MKYVDAYEGGQTMRTFGPTSVAISRERRLYFPCIFKPTFHFSDLNLSLIFFSFLYSIPIVFVSALITGSTFVFVLQ